jgi:hypothetical protein
VAASQPPPSDSQGALLAAPGFDLPSWLRRLAAKQSKPYQTLIHELLERAARN